MNIVVLKNNIIQYLKIHALMTVGAWTIHLMLNEGEGTDMEVSQVVVGIWVHIYVIFPRYYLPYLTNIYIVYV